MPGVTTREVVCPSGLTGRVRGWKIREANLLGSGDARRSGAIMNEVLAGCWTETTNPGPYDPAPTKPHDWSRILIGDRFVAMMNMRIATNGSAYEFRTQCEDGRCREPFPWTVDLEADFPVKIMAPEDVAQFQAGNRFTSSIEVDGKRVTFRLLVGADEQSGVDLKKRSKANLMTASLLHRIVEIEGVERLDHRRYVDDLPLPEARRLINAFDEADGGVDTSLEIECPFCRHVQEVEVPFGGEFFLPGKNSQK